MYSFLRSQLSATLEAHETLPPTIPLMASASSGSSAAQTRTLNYMKRVHSEYFCAFAMDTHRASFSLDIPADGTPAFGISAYDPDEGSGGLAWRVRMNFLVAVAPPIPSSPGPPTESVMRGDAEMLRTHVRDSPPGEWGSSSCASDSLAPLVRVDASPVARSNNINATPDGQLSNDNTNPMPTQNVASGGARGWASMLLGSGGASRSLSSGIAASTSQTSFPGDNNDEEDADDYDGKEDEDEDEERRDSGRWMPVEVQTVECEVPVSIWPGATAFRPRESVFEC